MKKSSLFFALPLFLLAASCAKESFMEVNADPNLIPLNIAGSIDQQHTKATADGFVDKDAIGLYAVNYTENNTVAGTLQVSGNQADNVKYVFDETNHKWTPVKSVYYKDVNTNADIYLYYPYQASISNMTAGNFEVSKDQSSEKTATSLSGYEASDFLWGKKAGVVPSEASVGVNLSHKMAAVKVTLAEGEGFEDGEFESLEKSIILTNTTRKATINYATGEVTKLGDPQMDGIVMCPQESGTWRAVVVPQTVAAGTQLFSITVNGISYAFKQAQDVEYPAGKQTNVTIKINCKAHTGEYEFVLTSTNIVDWVEDRNTHGGEARQYFVVNVETAGTLGRTIKAAGKNPDKIKNLKVCGSITSSDYYFMRDSMAILESLNLKECESLCPDPTGYNVLANWSKSQFVNEEDAASQYAWLVEQYGEPHVVDADGYCRWYREGVPPKRAMIPAGAFEQKKSLYNVELPEYLEYIEEFAFAGSNISGTLVIPEDVVEIRGAAFNGCTMLTGVQLSSKLQKIKDSAFYGCSSLSGRFDLPNSLKEIGSSAFSGCKFTGSLHLPDGLESLSPFAFDGCSSLIGDLIIPENIKEIPAYCFYCCGFNGHLDLNNVTSISASAFDNCHFQGELVIPEGVTSLGENAFYSNGFSSVIFPSTLRQIGRGAFSRNARITEHIEFPEGLLTIGDHAFSDCSTLQGVSFPSTLLSIGQNAFANCYAISKMVCTATQVPNVLPGAFDGVAKDNFTLEVPANMVSRYQAAEGWGDFRRIAGHYDFSVSRDLMRGLNAERSCTYTLRCPSGMNWSIESKPDWITVSPASGTGKTDVTVTMTEMPRTSNPMMNPDNIYEQIGTGRNGEVVFLLDGKDYRSVLAVEQYDSDYQDGQALTLQTATKGRGIDIVYIGDGYDARDIATGTYSTNVTDGTGHFFDIEPYRTYREYFNVRAIVTLSDDSGIGTVNTVKDSRFGSTFTQNRILLRNPDGCLQYVSDAIKGIEIPKTLVILLQNSSVYEGMCYMFGDGSAVACCPISADAYPYDYRGIIQHEAGGHGFGKLGDEYIYHNAFIQTCDCMDCEHPKSNYDPGSTFGNFKSLGWYRNLDMESDVNSVPWKHMIFDSQFSDYVDMFEGGYMHSRGIFRSEAISCMNNNIPYYSAISRQAMVERIMEYAGEEFSYEAFKAKDSNAFGTMTKSMSSKRLPFGEYIPDGKEHTYPIYAGDRPNLK